MSAASLLSSLPVTPHGHADVGADKLRHLVAPA
jgi:hypothetical protein